MYKVVNATLKKFKVAPLFATTTSIISSGATATKI